MPRSRNSRRRKMDRVETVMGRQIFVYSGTTMVSIPVQPASFTRALAMADNFQFYRFRKLRCIITPGDIDGNVSNFTLGYAPGAAFDTPPAANTDIIQLPKAVHHGSAKTVDTVLDIGPDELITDAPLRWYKTIAGTPDTQFEIQGNLYGIAGAGNLAAVSLVIEYEMELQSWNLASNSPFVKLPNLSVKPRQLDDKSSGDLSVKNTDDCVVISGVTYKRSTA